MKFRVIDTTTGKEPDMAAIAGEMWAVTLRPVCPVFALKDFGQLILLDATWRKGWRDCPDGRFRVEWEAEQMIHAVIAEDGGIKQVGAIVNIPPPPPGITLMTPEEFLASKPSEPDKLMLTVERDEDGCFVVSDSVFNNWGAGGTLGLALADYAGEAGRDFGYLQAMGRPEDAAALALYKRLLGWQ